MIRTTLKYVGIWAISMVLTMAFFVFIGTIVHYNPGVRDVVHQQMFSSCEIPPQLMAIRPARSDVWTVMNVETEESFRSTELCHAVREAISYRPPTK